MTIQHGVEIQRHRGADGEAGEEVDDGALPCQLHRARRHGRHRHHAADPREPADRLPLPAVERLEAEAAVGGQRSGHARQVRQARRIDVDGSDGHPLHAGGEGTHHVHEAHGAGSADDADLLSRAQLAAGGHPAVAIGSGDATAADPADEVVVDAADIDLDRPTEALAAEHDIDDALEAEQALQLLDTLGVGTEVDDVVEGTGRQPRGVGGVAGGQPGTAEDGGEHHAAGGVSHHRHQLGRGSDRQQGVDPVDGVAGVDHHQQAPSGPERCALLGGVGTLHARPRLQQAHRRGTGLLADGDEEALAGLGLDDDALVHQHVLLQAALEVVAEGRIGRCRQHVAIVGLHEGAVTHLVALDTRAHGDDAGTALVSWHGRLVARDVAGDAGQLLGRQEGPHLALARVGLEGMQQLGVAEADAYRFHLAQDLRRAQRGHRLGRVQDGPVGGDDLDRVLGRWDGAHDSITWPPVTGTAWPVSYCWATR